MKNKRHFHTLRKIANSKMQNSPQFSYSKKAKLIYKPWVFLQLLRDLSRHLSPERSPHKFVTWEAVKALGVFIGVYSCYTIDGPQLKYLKKACVRLANNQISSLLHKLGLLEWLWCNLRWRQSYTFQVLKQNDFNGDAMSNPVAHFFHISCLCFGCM